jgi:hypothetical protein
VACLTVSLNHPDLLSSPIASYTLPRDAIHLVDAAQNRHDGGRADQIR